MKKQRYGGSISWDGAVALVLPKQPATRRLVWLSLLATYSGTGVAEGVSLTIKDGSLDAARAYVCAGVLTAATDFETMFFFAEDVGNDTVIDTPRLKAMVTCSLGRECYLDAASKIEIEVANQAPVGNFAVTWVFEDID